MFVHVYICVYAKYINIFINCIYKQILANWMTAEKKKTNSRVYSFKNTFD